MLETLFDYNYRNNTSFSNEKLQQAASKVMAETEEKELNAKHNANNVNIYHFCQSSNTTNTQIRNTNVTHERRISLDVLSETIKVFNGLTLQSTINNSAYYNSDGNYAERYSKGDQLAATHTSD